MTCGTENHIDKYLESKEGLHFILNKMNIIQMRRELEKRGLKLDGTNK